GAGLRLIRMSLFTLVVGAAFSLGLLLVAPLLIVPVFGPSFAGAIPTVRLMAIIPLLLNVNACTSNLYMFNYGHERAWSSLNAFSLCVLLTVAYLLLSNLSDAATAVALAVIAKEAVVVVISGGFLVVFGGRALQTAPAMNAVGGGGNGVSAVVPAFVRVVRGRFPL
nr:hypothetical protein [Rhodopila sp.]